MGKRRSSRELALKFLYQSELNKGDIDEQMKLFLKQNSSQEEVETFMLELVKSILKQIPSKRLGYSQEIADLIKTIIPSSYLTGQSFVLDGGYSI